MNKKPSYKDHEDAKKGLYGDDNYITNGAETRMKAQEAQKKINEANKKMFKGNI